MVVSLAYSLNKINNEVLPCQAQSSQASAVLFVYSSSDSVYITPNRENIWNRDEQHPWLSCKRAVLPQLHKVKSSKLFAVLFSLLLYFQFEAAPGVLAELNMCELSIFSYKDCQVKLQSK